MIFGSDRRDLRRVFVRAWRKARAGEALEPLEDAIAAIVAEHPEYHALLADDDAIERDFPVGAGESNPFLHLAMHVAIQEQIATDRPAGIRALYAGMRARFGDAHALDHALMECLGRTLWEAQRAGREPDECAYLESVRDLVRRRARS